jgi:hypothetical protein
MAGEPLPSYNISLDGQPSSIWPARENVTENIANVLLVRKCTFSDHYTNVARYSTRPATFLRAPIS